jgi:uncharacterized protein (UPF0276 family)
VEFAINYSTQAAALLRAGQIRLDCFKCPDWPHVIAEAGQLLPVRVHFSYRTATPNSAPNFDVAQRMLRETQTRHINIHLWASRHSFPGWAIDSTDPQLMRIVTDCMVREISQAVDRFGANGVIAENIPYLADNDEFLRAGSEPSLIRQVIEQTGCGLLLDLSHARIAAHYMGLDAQQYIEQLPLDRLRELHLTGIGHNNGKLDDHMPFTADDWPITEWAMHRIARGDWPRPDLVALEYGGVGPDCPLPSDQSVIARDTPRIDQLLRSANLSIENLHPMPQTQTPLPQV